MFFINYGASRQNGPRPAGYHHDFAVAETAAGVAVVAAAVDYQARCYAVQIEAVAAEVAVVAVARENPGNHHHPGYQIEAAAGVAQTGAGYFPHPHFFDASSVPVADGGYFPHL